MTPNLLYRMNVERRQIYNMEWI